jgi:hypothetical protein
MNNLVKSRREFLLKIFSNKTKSISGLASSTPDVEQTDKIKMLTPDGKLVEVDSQILKNCKKTSKVKNAEILKWVKDVKEIY